MSCPVSRTVLRAVPDGDQPRDVRTGVDRIDLRGDGVTSAQPAAPPFGGLPSPDSSIGSVATRANSSIVEPTGPSVDSSSKPAGPQGGGLMADAGRSPPARRVIRLRDDQSTARRQHQQQQYQPGRGAPSSAGAVKDGSPDASWKGRNARSSGPERASQVPSRRRPMQSLFWVLKHRSRETAQLRGTGSFALVAEATRDGSVPRVCDLQGDDRPMAARCQPGSLHTVSASTMDGVQAIIC